MSTIPKRSERIKREKKEKATTILLQLLTLIIKAPSILNEVEKMMVFMEIYELILYHFDLLYEVKKCTDFFYEAFKKKEQIKTWIENEISEGKKLKKIFNRFKKLFILYEKKCLELVGFKTEKVTPTPLMEENCPICLEIITKKDIYKTKCMHSFHKKCILNHFYQRNNCPLCRSNLFTNYQCICS